MRRRLGVEGFTMVELSITVAVLGVLAAVAIPSFMNLMPRFRLGTATQTLANELAMARMAAIAKSVDGEMVFDKDAESYTIAKTIGGAPYAGTTLPSGLDLEGLTYVVDGSSASATVQLNANGTTNVPLQKQAVAITLATVDGAHKRRILVWATGRIHSQKWAGGSTWVAD
jgi:prepilin-type N-terminal cleavage/methylation domain-containing protein